MLKYTKLRQSYQRNTVLSPHFQSRQFSVLDHLPHLLPGCFEICRHPPDHQHLHHSYAVAALRSGDDIKTVQGNLGQERAVCAGGGHTHLLFSYVDRLVLPDDAAAGYL